MTQEKEVADRIMDAHASPKWRGSRRWLEYRDTIATALHTARDDGYRQGVGDAAGVARKEAARHNHPSTDPGRSSVALEIAHAILALTPSSALAEPGDGWQSPDSAPSDGQRVLVHDPRVKDQIEIRRADGEWWRRHKVPIRWRPLPFPPRIPSPGDTGE